MIDTIFSLDQSVLSWLVQFRQPWLTPIMMFFTRLGDEWLAYPAVILVALLLWRVNKSKADSWVFLSSLILSAVLNSSIKNLVERARPSWEPLLQLTDYSFPSGHAMNSIVFFGFLAYLVTRRVRPGTQRNLIVTSLFATSGLMGLSRIYLGVHYLSDVVIGYGLGILILIGAILLVKKLNQGNTSRYKEKADET